MNTHYQTDRVTIYQADVLDLLASLDAESVSLIFMDPPYKGVKKNLWWDNQWKTNAAFLDWLGLVLDGCKRALAPNGSLYACASPRMAHAVEGLVRARYNVLNSIRWYKDAGWHKKAEIGALRSYLEPWESIVFAEPWGADGNAMNQSGYLTQSAELWSDVFEPIQSYLAGEFKRAGVKYEKANEFCNVASMAGRHYFTRSQWCMPTKEHYESLQRGLNDDGSREYLRRDYEYLRRDYEHLRRDYERLRRPFTLTKDRPTTDLWTYESVQHDDEKHETAKPLPMLRDIIATSSRPGGLVVDPFLGGGTTAIACLPDRRFIGGDIQEHWCKATVARLSESRGEMRTPVKRPVEARPVPKGQRTMEDFLRDGLE